MNLIIDFGNTRCKFYFFDGNSICKSFVFDNNVANFQSQMLNIVNKSKIDYAIISSVTIIPDFLITLLSDVCKKLIKLDYTTTLPISIGYTNRAQLGNDRIAVSVGATVLFPQRDVLVVDAGTAITYEFVQQGKNYMGGSISPGLNIRFASLNEHTAKLPLVHANLNSEYIATNTQDAINNGVVNGLIAEILWNISFAKTKLQNPEIILTGGDTIFLVEKLKNTIFAEPNLLAIGLNRILQYNVFKNN